MYLCKPLGLKYFGMPRTGCRSVCTWLMEEVGFRQCDNDMHGYGCNGDKDCRIFTTVRHPYRRVLSRWASIHGRTNEATPEEVGRFTTWLEAATGMPCRPEGARCIPWSMGQFLRPFADVVQPLLYLRTEHLEEDLGKLFDCPMFNLPQRGKSKHGPWQAYFANERSRQIVQQKHADDFERFGFGTSLEDAARGAAPELCRGVVPCG